MSVCLSVKTSYLPGNFGGAGSDEFDWFVPDMLRSLAMYGLWEMCLHSDGERLFITPKI